MTERSAQPDNSTGSAGAERAASSLSRAYLDALRAADARGAYRTASRALEEGMTLSALYQRVIAPAMHEIGVLWERGAITVADEHLATELTHRVLAALRPPIRVEFPPAPERSERPRAVLATVEGERHALGLRMAGDLLEDAGFHTVYLGADVPTEALLQAVAALSPSLLALSATMPEAAPRLREIEEATRGLEPELKLLVGGQAAAPGASAQRAAISDLERLSEEISPPP